MDRCIDRGCCDGMPDGERARGTLPPVAKRIFDFDAWMRVLEIGTGDDWEAAYAGPAADLVAG